MVKKLNGILTRLKIDNQYYTLSLVLLLTLGLWLCGLPLAAQENEPMDSLTEVAVKNSLDEQSAKMD